MMGEDEKGRKRGAGVLLLWKFMDGEDGWPLVQEH
jgi:hypothetical protein